MDPLIINFVAGAFGQGVRELIGFKKMLQKGKEFDSYRAGSTFLLGTVIGGCIGIMSGNPGIAALSGYGVTDAVEGLTKKNEVE